MPQQLDDDATIDSLVAAVVASVAHDGGAPRIPADALHAHARAIAAVDDAARRDRIAEELVAFAVRAVGDEEDAGDAFDDVVMQLSALAAVALADARMGALLERAGVSPDKARAIIGAASSWKPVGADGRVAGAKSPLGALLDARAKKR